MRLSAAVLLALVLVAGCAARAPPPDALYVLAERSFERAAQDGSTWTPPPGPAACPPIARADPATRTVTVAADPRQRGLPDATQVSRAEAVVHTVGFLWHEAHPAHRLVLPADLPARLDLARGDHDPWLSLEVREDAVLLGDEAVPENVTTTRTTTYEAEERGGGTVRVRETLALTWSGGWRTTSAPYAC